jgi:predicted RNase H-like HicB family nuclease
LIEGPADPPGSPTKISIECEREDGGRWLAEVPDLPGVLAYGNTVGQAQATAQVLALRVLVERLEHGEVQPAAVQVINTVPR